VAFNVELTWLLLLELCACCMLWLWMAMAMLNLRPPLVQGGGKAVQGCRFLVEYISVQLKHAACDGSPQSHS
jgi:hypothetical protein